FSSRRRNTRLVSDWSSDVYSSDLHHTFVLFLLILVLYTGVNIFADKLLGMFNNISVWWHVLGVLLIIGILAFVPDHHKDAGFVFGQLQNNTASTAVPTGARSSSSTSSRSASSSPCTRKRDTTRRPTQPRRHAVPRSAQPRACGGRSSTPRSPVGRCSSPSCLRRTTSTASTRQAARRSPSSRRR